jgi:hypothetical protein
MGSPRRHATNNDDQGGHVGEERDSATAGNRTNRHHLRAFGNGTTNHREARREGPTPAMPALFSGAPFMGVGRGYHTEDGRSNVWKACTACFRNAPAARTPPEGVGVRAMQSSSPTWKLPWLRNPSLSPPVEESTAPRRTRYCTACRVVLDDLSLRDPQLHPCSCTHGTHRIYFIRTVTVSAWVFHDGYDGPCAN